jgi:hypothetical protein
MRRGCSPGLRSEGEMPLCLPFSLSPPLPVSYTPPPHREMDCDGLRRTATNCDGRSSHFIAVSSHCDGPSSQFIALRRPFRRTFYSTKTCGLRCKLRRQLRRRRSSSQTLKRVCVHRKSQSQSSQFVTTNRGGAESAEIPLDTSPCPPCSPRFNPDRVSRYRNSPH